MPNQELAGKVAIVTGGASGLGRATVELFVEEGANVVIADINTEGGEELATKLGDAAEFKRTDVSNPDEVQGLVDFAVERFGGLDVMFNNAGIGQPLGSFLDDDLKDFDHVVRVNLLGTMVGTQRAARYMQGHGGGSIINNSSIGGIQAAGGVMTYRATKAGIIHITKSIATELGPYGIRVNCIAPGLIATPMTSYDLGRVRSSLQPLNREGLPSDIANAVLFLASDRSAQITGIVLPVDGGTSAGRPGRLKDAAAPAKSTK